MEAETLIERKIRLFEERERDEAWELHEKITSPNGLSFHEMLEAVTDVSLRVHMVSERYAALLQEKGLSSQEAKRVLRYAARGLLPADRVEMAMDRGALLLKKPDAKETVLKAGSPAEHRKRLECNVRSRNSLESVRINIAAIDSVLPGGIRRGEALQLVGGEGSMKTSLLLHMLGDALARGIRVLFFSLDMSPQRIETRRLALAMRQGERSVEEHIRMDTAEYRGALKRLAEQDELLNIIGGPLTVGQMRSAIVAVNPDVVCLDYITAVSGYKSELETAREVGACVRRWRDRWGLAFVLLSQVSRQAKLDQRGGAVGSHAMGGSTFEQLVDYEIELIKDVPLPDKNTPRLIATVTKNRQGPNMKSFEIFPNFPEMSFQTYAVPVERAAVRKPLFGKWGGC